MQKRLKLRNQIEELEKIKEAISAIVDGLPARETVEFEMNLIAEELFTNVVRYAYRDNAEHEIQMELSAINEGWEIRLQDTGVPFNPTLAPEPDVSRPIQERSVGGLGIHLIRKMADDFEYERKDDTNIVSVRKKTPPT